ncbi:hypothetical protein [Paenibacillus sp. KS-LC4]|uniref:hypothetical protein n=1 Tax=Paenibacillus sp. KS-LC4 TaxID=2979727 RepID=UPI0030D23532
MKKSVSSFSKLQAACSGWNGGMTMRSLLAAILLLITIVMLYSGIAEGDQGMNKQLERSGHATSSYIRTMSP